MIGRRKLVDGLDPQLDWKMKLGRVAQSNGLDLRVRVLRENRSENRLQFIDAAAKQLEDLLLARRDAVQR